MQLGTNTKGIFDGWNIGTTRWLRECVYDRVPKQFSVVAVFFVSAFWHGFYPVYYLCFLTGAFLTSTGRHVLSPPPASVPYFGIYIALGPFFSILPVEITFRVQSVAKVAYVGPLIYP
ncbi:unnamed protein product [Dibothriocephalus latus]|uniref:Uncharacterized protein n=1 Tax=Dibothriocephalus latus TaxID=60516 RepID=A0A3P6QNG7_DIBLA|nr:unnamed protein product [Dibothriocephalus latus]